LNIRLKANSDGADVMTAGRLFQTRAAATEKELSPMVEQRVTGTLSANLIGLSSLCHYCTSGSAPGPTLDNEYERSVPFLSRTSHFVFSHSSKHI